MDYGRNSAFSTVAPSKVGWLTVSPTLSLSPPPSFLPPLLLLHKFHKQCCHSIFYAMVLLCQHITGSFDLHQTQIFFFGGGGIFLFGRGSLSLFSDISVSALVSSHRSHKEKFFHSAWNSIALARIQMYKPESHLL